METPVEDSMFKYARENRPFRGITGYSIKYLYDEWRGDSARDVEGLITNASRIRKIKEEK
jgi:hypothetical protein